MISWQASPRFGHVHGVGAVQLCQPRSSGLASLDPGWPMLASCIGGQGQSPLRAHGRAKTSLDN